MLFGAHIPAWIVVGAVAASVALAQAPKETADSAARGQHVAARVLQQARVPFPARPLAEGVVRGQSVVMLEIDAFGELRDVLVVAYTHRDFADAVLTALKSWRFAPGFINGEPAASNIRIVVDFQVNGVHAFAKAVGTSSDQPPGNDNYIYRPWEIASLDRVPASISQPSPIYPREWIQAGRAGRVVVDFFIDEEGRARFPEVAGEADEMLGLAATLAVKDWRFESPLRDGQPVLARVQQVFNFRPPAPSGKSDRPAKS